MSHLSFSDSFLLSLCVLLSVSDRKQRETQKENEQRAQGKKERERGVKIKVSIGASSGIKPSQVCSATACVWVMHMHADVCVWCSIYMFLCVRKSIYWNIWQLVISLCFTGYKLDSCRKKLERKTEESKRLSAMVEQVSWWITEHTDAANL